MNANANQCAAHQQAASTLPPILQLQKIVQQLRSPDGCPWDREQTLLSLRHCLLEETHEILAALENPSYHSLSEEVGDLLLVLFMMCQIAEEQGIFNLDSVATQICDKLIRRHPHVFANHTVKNSDEVLQNWEDIKRRERGEETASVLDGVPRSMPSLLRCQTLQKKAARVGFDWKDFHGPLNKIYEELQELTDTINQKDEAKLENEAGDLLFACVNLLRKLAIQSEIAAHKAADKFEKRFRAMEALAKSQGHNLYNMSLQQMDELWEQVKSVEKSNKNL
ncbi:MAG: nucleoside triphosphate pyrophosphohydrolase [Chthoniobacterales bacterium]|nr:nucleoside triphosphate pyrophosphohydrolase [Chthoniobacterales bacterium]